MEDNNWFNILKESRQISDTKTKVNLITEPIVMEEEDKFPCCEEARKKALQIIDFREKDFVKEANCEDLYWKIHNLALTEIKLFHSPIAPNFVNSRPFKEIRDDWDNCVNSSTNIEQQGWNGDYRDVE